MRTDTPFNWIMFGVGGFVAQRHLKAISELGDHTLIGALDKSESVGILDRYFPDCEFFTEPERFDRWLALRKRKEWGQRPHWAAVCSPNYLHDAHCRMALQSGCMVICEKPVVINPWNVQQLQDDEAEYDQSVFVVHQLRHHVDLKLLKRTEEESPREPNHPAVVDLTYCTPRGRWYSTVWKGNEAMSGGIVMNLGIHFLDALVWIFGGTRRHEVHLKTKDRMGGYLELDNAIVRWFLSTNPEDCPGWKPNRSMTVDGRKAFDFNRRFTDHHRDVYIDAMDGQGVTLDDAYPVIDLAHDLRMSTATQPNDADRLHPMVEEIIG